MTALAAFVLVAGPLRAQTATPVKLSELPRPVQETIRAQAGKGKVVNIEKSVAGGEVTYDVEFRKDGRMRSLGLGESGKVLEMEVFLEEVNPPVREAIKTQAGTNEIASISRQAKNDRAIFEVECVASPKNRGFTVDEAGKLVERQVSLSELPAPVRQTIQKQAGSDKIGDIIQEFAGADSNFEVELNPGERSRVLTLDPQGNVTSQEAVIAFSDAPAPVQKAIKALGSGSPPDTLTKTTEDDETTYNVAVRQGTESKTISFDTTGDLVE